MKSDIRVGVLGAGRIGRLHIEHLQYRLKGVEVAAVSDVYKEAADKAASDFQVPLSFQDSLEVIRHKDVDAVIICSSTDTHAQFIEESARAGKHVFCEKPIALDLAEIDRALEAVDQAGIKLQIGFNRRFDANHRRVWEHLRQGTIGKPHILRIASRDPSPPPIGYIKVSGGIFLDMMIHDFDMARYLIEDEVESLYATAGVMVDPEIGKAGDVDTAIVTMKFKNGVIGTIDNSRQAVFGYDQRVEVFGEKGMVSSENFRPNAVTVSGTEHVWQDLPFNFFMERYVDSYLIEMQEFLQAVAGSTEPSVTGIDARVPVVMGLAAKKSFNEGRPVSLDEISS